MPGQGWTIEDGPGVVPALVWRGAPADPTLEADDADPGEGDRLCRPQRRAPVQGSVRNPRPGMSRRLIVFRWAERMYPIGVRYGDSL